MKRFILAFFCMTAAVGPAVGQSGSLADLIRSGNRKAALERIRAAGTDGTDVNAAQPDGTRPIHWAVYKVDYEVLEALCASGEIRRTRQLAVEFHHGWTDRTLQDTENCVAQLAARGFELRHGENRNYLFLRRDG